MTGGWILAALFLWGAYKIACWLGEEDHRAS